MNINFEKIPSWLMAIAIFGIFLIILFSINTDSTYQLAGYKFGPTIESTDYPLGTVAVSLLDYGEFSYEVAGEENIKFDSGKSKWAPADGRAVPDSDYVRYNNFVPDLRGQFLRGVNTIHQIGSPKNHINSEDIGLRKEANGYSYQKESTKLPSNGFLGKTTGGNHEHSFTAIIKTGSKQNIPDANGPQVKNGKNGTTGGGHHAHKVIINSGGDPETRPNNLAVYYYIRINR